MSYNILPSITAYITPPYNRISLIYLDVKYFYHLNNSSPLAGIFLGKISHGTFSFGKKWCSCPLHNVYPSPNMAKALIPPANGRVMTHANTMFLKSFQSTFSRDLIRPTLTTDPTLQWVELIGMPMLEARSTVMAEPISMQKPLQQTIQL